MPNITRGDRMVGLVLYLVGPGRANEHTEPHLIAGDSAVMAWHGTDELGADEAVEIAHALDHPRRAFGTEIKQGHVWHCSLSLRAEEGRIPDEKWAEIAEDFMAEMRFLEDGRSPVRWVAIHHGQSKAGNDHVHLAVNLVREDGTRANVWNDRPRAQAACKRLEAKHGLQQLESRHTGRSAPGVKPAELADQRRRGAAEPQRRELERVVRAAAAAAADEAEFVRRLRADGVLLAPRTAAGAPDVVTGWRAALRPERGQRPMWLAGGQLAPDLTLPALRERWPDDPAAATAAAREWTAAKRHRRAVAPGRERLAPTAADWERVTGEVGAMREFLRGVPVDDHDTWRRIAREASGAFAAWSRRVETTPGPLADAAAALSRSGWRRGVAPAARRAGPSARGAAMLLASIGHGGRGTVAQAVLLRQLMNTAKALHDAHLAAGEAQRAAEIARVMRGQLIAVRDSLPAVDAQPAPAAAVRPVAAAGRPAGSPVPNVLPAARRAAQHGFDVGR